MAKVVIDANVIISAAFGGNPLRAVIRAMEEDELYLSQAIERELTEVLSKLSKKLTREQIANLNERMREFVGMAKQVSVSTRVVLSRDAKDDHYLALCKEVKADFLVTGNKDLLTIPPEALKENGIPCRILTPQEFAEGV
jgi:putative PIN family toxin of toxin-antitoxin system